MASRSLRSSSRVDFKLPPRRRRGSRAVSGDMPRERPPAWGLTFSSLPCVSDGGHFLTPASNLGGWPKAEVFLTRRRRPL